MFEWKWLELAFFHPPSTVSVAKKTRSSCFKHLQMVMYQQLVSVQPSYCRGIKKTGQSWRCTANLPRRVGEHFPWKKEVLYSCRDRQDGSPAESVPCLAEEAARADEPNARATGKRGVRGLAGFAGAALLPLCPPRGARTRVGARLSLARVSVRAASDRRPVPVSGGSYTAVPLSLCLGSLLSIRQSFSFLYIRAEKRKGKKKSHENPALSSLFPCPRPLGDIERNPQNSHATVPACAASQTPGRSGVFFGVLFISGNCNTQSMLLR